MSGVKGEGYVHPGLNNSRLSCLIANPVVEAGSALRSLDNLLCVEESQAPGSKESGKKRKSKAKKASTGAAKGTGFGGGTGDNSGMKAKVQQATEDEAKQDGAVQTILENLRKHLPSAVKSAQMLSKLQQSKGWCALCFRLLRNDSFLDVGKRGKLYRPFMGLLLMIAKHPNTVEFLSHPLYEDEDEEDEENDSADSTQATCKQLLTALGSQARIYRQLQGKTKSPGKISFEVDESVVMADLIIDTEKAVNSFVDLTVDVPSTPSKGDVFDLTCDDDDMIVWIPGGQAAGASSSGSSSSAPSSSNKRPRLSEGAGAGTAAVTQVQEEARYVKQMLPHRFAVVDMCSMIASGRAAHLFHAQQLGTAAQGKQRMMRIAKEMATLSTNLPVEYGSSVLVRVDESRMDLIKALIIGPEGTPYENGCFEFDILLPANYPQGPPSMLLVTTGKGTVRFNPNLYNCGKVCLSLLGTWAGPGWDAQHSTLLQVLVSIQALILVPDPYYNEPGYGEPRKCPQSESYSSNIRLQCMKFAMLEQLKSPSPLFSEAIHAHFRNKRDAILRQVGQWAAGSAAHAAAARSVEQQLSALV